MIWRGTLTDSRTASAKQGTQSPKTAPHVHVLPAPRPPGDTPGLSPPRRSVFPVLRPSRVDLPRDPKVVELQARLGELKLSNKAIEERETARIAATKAFLEDESRKGVRDAGYILRSQTPWFVMVPYRALCWFLDVVFEDRPIQRFWFLETVARMPYFSYLSTLFLFETLGWWSGGAEVRKVHFAEEYNEMQHLRIMESLGGDTRWSDRFLARHAAIIYFFVLTLVSFSSRLQENQGEAVPVCRMQRNTHGLRGWYIITTRAPGSGGRRCRL